MESMSEADGFEELEYEASGLPKTTNWWGAFVIGLAGTILVTGIAPAMVTIAGRGGDPVDRSSSPSPGICCACSWRSSRR